MKKIAFRKIKGWDVSHRLNSTITPDLTGVMTLFLYVNVSLLKAEYNKSMNDCWYSFKETVIFEKDHGHWVFPAIFLK